MSNECSCVGVRLCPEFVQSPGSDNPLGSGHLHLGVVLVPAVHVHLQVLLNISNVIINHGGGALGNSASKSSIRRFVITEKAPTRAFSWLKAATTAFTFKTLLRHYAEQALTPRSLNVN